MGPTHRGPEQAITAGTGPDEEGSVNEQAADDVAGSADSSPGPSAPQPDLNVILKAIHNLLDAMEHTVDELRVDFSLIQ
ncbi:hypothetical protein NDU88_004093 [Pleurodeles waltl]|uniref:Heat shock factor binding protein 1 n=1 Tax=Pleurodeles waltl TaxID=8319 RepID=A0AAV7W8T1_PLEWA|nr:hypothetical protein NDU88_004093 [Pleurodeles waltl]